MQDESNQNIILELAVDIVTAYVSNNPVSTKELPELFGSVHAAVASVGGQTKAKYTSDAKPAVPIKKSITDDYLICLEDGKKFKSLKRHLRSHYDMSPEEYKMKWGLPSDYPMVAPSYAQKRSQLARDLGLGRKPGTKLKK